MAQSSSEKRKCKRYNNVNDCIVVLFDNRLGKLIDISENSLAIHLYNSDITSLPKKCKVSLLAVAKDFMVEDLPITLVRKQVISSSFKNIIAAKFNTSDAIKLRTIKKYISSLS